MSYCVEVPLPWIKICSLPFLIYSLLLVVSRSGTMHVWVCYLYGAIFSKICIILKAVLQHLRWYSWNYGCKYGFCRGNNIGIRTFWGEWLIGRCAAPTFTLCFWKYVEGPTEWYFYIVFVGSFSKITVTGWHHHYYALPYKLDRLVLIYILFLWSYLYYLFWSPPDTST